MSDIFLFPLHRATTSTRSVLVGFRSLQDWPRRTPCVLGRAPVCRVQYNFLQVWYGSVFDDGKSRRLPTASDHYHADSRRVHAITRFTPLPICQILHHFTDSQHQRSEGPLSRAGPRLASSRLGDTVSEREAKYRGRDPRFGGSLMSAAWPSKFYLS